MNNVTFIQKIYFLPAMILGTVGFATLTQTSQAVILIVDPPDSTSVTFTHLSGDSYALIQKDPSLEFTLMVERTSGVTAEIGDSLPSGNSFSSGEGFPAGNPLGNSSVCYVDFSEFRNGASSGLNYARFDVDGNGVYETVVEFDFGVSAAIFDDDVITRYAYDDAGSSLTIPSAVELFTAVPEPSSMILCLMGVAAGFCRRR